MSCRLEPELERALVDRARREAQAFAELYSHYFPRVYAYVRYRVGRAQDAEDLVSEIFLRMVAQIGRFEWRGEGSLAAWMYRIATNAVNDFYRKQQRHTEPSSLDDLPELDLETSLLGPEDTMLRKERFGQLRRLIQTISPRKQEVITLKFFGGLRNQEISAILGIDEKTVAADLCRGLQELHRRYVEQYGAEEACRERAKRTERARSRAAGEGRGDPN